jgi:hypothetical protein
MIRTRLKVVLGILPAAAVVLGFALPASAAPISVSGTTYLPDNGDSGNGAVSIWADDAFHRDLTVTAAPSVCSVPVTGLTCYVATISDSGTFTTRPGNGHAPNPNSVSDPGTNIAYPPVSGPFSGGGTYIFQTAATPAPANIPDVVNNHGSSSPPALHSTSDWFANAFASGTTFYNSDGQEVTLGGTNDTVLQNSWGWSYTSMTGAGKHTLAVDCESWTDSFANGAGDTPGDSNITGKQCAGTPKPHYTRVPDCLSRRVYICTGLLGGRGLGWVIENPRKPGVAYFVKGQTPDPGSVVLKGTVVHLNDVHKL